MYTGTYMWKVSFYDFQRLRQRPSQERDDRRRGRIGDEERCVKYKTKLNIGII